MKLQKAFWKYEWESERDWDGGYTNRSWYVCSKCGHIEKYSDVEICPSCKSYMQFQSTLTVGELKKLLNNFNDNDKVCVSKGKEIYTIKTQTDIMNDKYIIKHFGDEGKGIVLNIKSKI